MWALVILAILAVALFFVIKKIKALDKQEEVAEKESYLPENATLKDVRVGGVISIDGFMENYQDLDFVVNHRHRYEQDDFQWYELVGSSGTEKLYLEWEYDDDEFFITATNSKKGFRLSKLGISEEDLIRMDEEGSDENFIEYEGEKYYYESSDEVFYYENERGSGEGFYVWDFINEDETKVISIERWEDEPFEVFTGTVINERDITIYKVKE